MLQAEIEPGTLINNRYEIQRVLGQGGFGRTYLAYDVERFGEFCVLKEFVPSIRTEYVIQKSRELFEREARVLYQLNHPQIPKFLAWFTHADGLFLVQEYIDGKTYASLLQQRQQRGQVFSQAEVVQWLKDLLSVLCYLHGRNIVHRDISPDNVILPYGQTQPVLIDFGLVKQQVSQVWASSPESLAGAGQHSFVGKFGYAPPEQIRMGHCHPYSDLYALAVTALVLLTGREPNWLIDQGSLEWKWRSYVTVSDYLAQMLDKMLAEKPRDRYQSAEEVLKHLQLYASAGTVATFQPLVELQIEIDEVRRHHQVAEIEETDFFRQLQEQAELLRNNPEPDSETQPDAESSPLPTVIEEALESNSSSPFSSGSQPEAATRSKINPAFVDYCQQELARCIGPMASCILDETLTKYPDLSEEQLVEALATEIPHPQKAQQFKNSVIIEPESHPQPASSPQLNPEFIKRCKQELARCIGPMASCILDDTLADNPNLSQEQLVEALAAQIPLAQKALEFRHSIIIEPESKPQLASSSKPNAEFIQRCKQELARCIGPMASCILDEALTKYPDLSQEQLVETLATQIPHTQKAQEFRKSVIVEPGTQPQQRSSILNRTKSIYRFAKR
ncbi:MAG TPA: serine/threonine-protein kinase [Waterburya sp.]|jgi:serine/threonine-protein kinase